jgi:hypothetical protein
MRAHRAFALAIAATACTSDPRLTETTAAIQNGALDGAAHPFVVGVCVTSSGPGNCIEVCSGTLIAPNLVMTARHCVAQSPSTIDCATSSFGAINGSASNYWITTSSYMFQGTTGWHQAQRIVVTPGSLVCGNDLAFLVLHDNVSPQEAPNAIPVVQNPMTDHSRFSTTVTAIGFGNTSATGSGAGTRRIKQQINLSCIPGDPLIDCGPQSQLDTKEFVSGDGLCSGDSGSSAFEQNNFNNGIWMSFGVLSRGGVSGDQCVGSVYTRTDAWSSLIISTALEAAQLGGYATPTWAQSASPPPVDAGTDATPGTPPPPQTPDAAADPSLDATIAGGCAVAADSKVGSAWWLILLPFCGRRRRPR